MAYSQILRRMVFPTIEFFDGVTSYTVAQAGYSPGFTSWSKAESVRRVRPSNLSDFSSLTGFGGHQREVLIREPVSYMTPNYPRGYIKYNDMDPQDWTSVGAFASFPQVDWQTALRLAVKDQKVNLAQTLAEYKQAQNMFASNATTIAKALRQLKRGDMKGVFNTLNVKPKQLRGSVSNRWLELQYGWRPLIQDLYGSVEELQMGLQRPRYRKLKVHKTDENRFERIDTLQVGVNRRKAVIDSRSKTTVKVVAYLKQSSTVSNRLGFTNPVNLAWELLPYSFVIDWLIPIGDWLNSLDAAIGLEEIYGTVTTKYKSICTNSFGPMYYLYEYYGRSVFYGLPNAPLPVYKPSLGVSQIANALALLSQLKR